MTEAVQDQSLEDSFFNAVEDATNQGITEAPAADAAGDVQHQASSEQTEQVETQEVAASAAANGESAQQGLTPEQLEHQVKSEKGRTAALNRKHAEAKAEIARLTKQNQILQSQQVPDLPALGDDADLAPNLAAFVSAQHESNKQQHQANIEANREQLEAAERRAIEIAAAYVEERAPGWWDATHSPEYVNWLRGQSPGIQFMSEHTQSPDDVVYLVTQFRNAVKPQAAKVADTVQQRQARLLNSVSPKSAAKPVRQTVSDSFNSVEDAFFAQV